MKVGSTEDTERLGESLAGALEIGDVIALSGPLGVGKTRLVAGLARGLGWQAGARSPTFTQVNEYRGRRTLFHVDLYRVESADLESLGLEELVQRGVLVVEWGEKLPRSLREEALWLEIELASELERNIGVLGTPQGRGVKLLEAWNSVVVRASTSYG